MAACPASAARATGCAQRSPARRHAATTLATAGTPAAAAAGAAAATAARPCGRRHLRRSERRRERERETRGRGCAWTWTDSLISGRATGSRAGQSTTVQRRAPVRRAARGGCDSIASGGSRSSAGTEYGQGRSAVACANRRGPRTGTGICDVAGRPGTASAALVTGGRGGGPPTGAGAARPTRQVALPSAGPPRRRRRQAGRPDRARTARGCLDGTEHARGHPRIGLDSVSACSASSSSASVMGAPSAAQRLWPSGSGPGLGSPSFESALDAVFASITRHLSVPLGTPSITAISSNVHSPRGGEQQRVPQLLPGARPPARAPGAACRPRPPRSALRSAPRTGARTRRRRAAGPS